MARSRRPVDRDDPPDHELDLHGLRAEQALRRLAQELHAWRVLGVERALVITGRGLQSESGPILGPLVETWFATAEARALGIAEWKPKNSGGAFEVRLDRGTGTAGQGERGR